MKLDDITLSEISHKKTNTVWLHLYEVPKLVAEFIEKESRRVVTRGCREK